MRGRRCGKHRHWRLWFGQFHIVEVEQSFYHRKEEAEVRKEMGSSYFIFIWNLLHPYKMDNGLKIEHLVSCVNILTLQPQSKNVECKRINSIWEPLCKISVFCDDRHSYFLSISFVLLKVTSPAIASIHPKFRSRTPFTGLKSIMCLTDIHMCPLHTKWPRICFIKRNENVLNFGGNIIP